MSSTQASTSAATHVSPARPLALHLSMIAAGSLLVAVAAHLSVPLPFTPVPLTLGNLAVVLVGLALGPAEAFAALMLYLAEGATGLPVFSPVGPGGIAQLLGPTGGFLLSYPLAAASASLVTRRFLQRAPGARQHLPRFARGLLAAGFATTLVMTLGACWLGFLLHLSTAHALQLGVLPFWPGELVKIVAAAGIYSTLRSRDFEQGQRS